MVWAYWTGDGTGSGSVTAGTVSGLTLSASATGLVPGASQTINVTGTNGNATTSIAVSHLSLSSFTSGVTACDNLATGAKATATAADPSGAPVVVAPNGGTATVGTVTISFPNSATVDQSACKGVTWTFSLSAS